MVMDAVCMYAFVCMCLSYFLSYKCVYVYVCVCISEVIVCMCLSLVINTCQSVCVKLKISMIVCAGAQIVRGDSNIDYLVFRLVT